MTYLQYLEGEYNTYLKKRDELDRDLVNGSLSSKEYEAGMNSLLKDFNKVFY